MFFVPVSSCIQMYLKGASRAYSRYKSILTCRFLLQLFIALDTVDSSLHFVQALKQLYIQFCCVLWVDTIREAFEKEGVFHQTLYRLQQE